jgi:hypothetical protein
MLFLDEREREYSSLYKESGPQVDRLYFWHAMAAVRELKRKAKIKWQK